MTDDPPVKSPTLVFDDAGFTDAAIIYGRVRAEAEAASNHAMALLKQMRRSAWRKSPCAEALKERRQKRYLARIARRFLAETALQAWRPDRPGN